MARAPSPADNRPPWLEEAPRERQQSFVSARLLWLVVGALVLLGVGIAVGVAIIARDADAPIEAQAMGGEVPLIRSPGPWKQRPADPGGRAVEGQGQVIYGAGDGEDPGGAIDLGAVPEAAVERPGTVRMEPVADPPAVAPEAVAQPAPAPLPAPAPVVAQPRPRPVQPRQEVVVRPQAPAPAPVQAARVAPASSAAAAAAPAAAASGGGGTVLQLGAFSSEAKAREAWKGYSKRFGYLAGLTPAISAVKRGEATLYRLRANGAADAAAAANLCARLRVAGEPCDVVG